MSSPHYAMTLSADWRLSATVSRPTLYSPLFRFTAPMLNKARRATSQPSGLAPEPIWWMFREPSPERRHAEECDCRPEGPPEGQRQAKVQPTCPHTVLACMLRRTRCAHPVYTGGTGSTMNSRFQRRDGHAVDTAWTSSESTEPMSSGF